MNRNNRRHESLTSSRQKNNKGNDVYNLSSSSVNDEDRYDDIRFRTFHCPLCHTLLSATKDQIGNKIVCPDCESKVLVPETLDFDTPTENERLRDRKKKERDILYSPLTNPNREGVESIANEVYSIRDDNNTQSRSEDVVFYPVRCRVCETLMHATKDMLGREICCPDCGVKTVVTDALKNQQEALRINFQPTSHDYYEIGEVPESSVVSLMKSDGTIMHVDPKERVIAPTISFAKFRNKTFKNQVLTSSIWDKSEKEKEMESELASCHRVKSRIELWIEKRAARKRTSEEKSEDYNSYYPAPVLRRKNSVLVWSLPSPPEKAPLFNNTLRPICDQEIWARGGIVVVCLGLIAALYVWMMKPSYEMQFTMSGSLTGAIAQGEFLTSLIAILVLGIPAAGFGGLYFWSVFIGGNSGSSRILEWRTEGPQEFCLYAIWFFSFISLATVPGIIIGGLCSSSLSTILYSLPFDLSELEISLENGMYSLPLDISELDISLETCVFWFVFTGFFWFFFPIFWISTHQTDMPFFPITGAVFESFYSKPKIWLDFFLVSTFFFWVPSFFWMLTFDSFLWIVTGPFFIPAVFMTYGLFLGRLSWIIDDMIRLKDYDDIG